MFVIENFGSWIIDTRKGLIFGIVVTLLSAWILWKTMFGSITVLFGRDFECVMSVPDGLAAKCVEYHVKRK